MRITFITAGLAGGGAERVVSELATEFSNIGNDVSVIIIGSKERKYYIPEEVRVIDCADIYAVPGIGFLKRVSKIRKEIKKIKPDICISFNTNVNIYSILSCVGVHCKLVISERNDPFCYPKSKMVRIMRSLLYHMADKFVFQTKEAQQFFSKKIQRKSTVIFNPINQLLPEPYEGKRTLRIVTACRLEPQKNLKMAIDAFERATINHQEFKFEIYGKGKLYNELLDYINAKGLQDRVFLMGNSTQLYKDILDAYAFVLSSDFEGMSNSMLEAIALGIPTISTDYPSGGARAIIKDGINGILVPLKDTEAMAAALLNLIENPELARQLKNNGIKLRNDLALKRIALEWINFIK